MRSLFTYYHNKFLSQNNVPKKCKGQHEKVFIHPGEYTVMLILDPKVIIYILSSLCLPEKDVSLHPCQETQPLCRINLFIVTKDKLLNIYSENEFQ